MHNIAVRSYLDSAYDCILLCILNCEFCSFKQILLWFIVLFIMVVIFFIEESNKKKQRKKVGNYSNNLSPCNECTLKFARSVVSFSSIHDCFTSPECAHKENQLCIFLTNHLRQKLYFYFYFFGADMLCFRY